MGTKSNDHGNGVAIYVHESHPTNEHSNKTAEKQTLLFLRRYKKKKMISETNRHERNQNTLGKWSIRPLINIPGIRFQIEIIDLLCKIAQ